MFEETKSRYEQELLEDAEKIMKEVNSNPDLEKTVAPSEMHDNVFRAIREIEAEQVRANMSQEDKELIRLGRIYKRKRKYRKYWVLAAVIVLAMALGMTSMGGPKRVYEKITWMLAGREQTNVDSDSENVERLTEVREEEVYEEIEEKYGFYPVRLNYLPEGVEFQEAAVGDEIQGIYMIYGTENKAYIKYIICLNYRTSSWGKDVEDELVEEYQIDVKGVAIQVQKYLVEDASARWIIRFETNDANYLLVINKLEKEEVEKVINNLYFISSSM